MEFLSRHWKSRTLILLLLGAIVSLLMWCLQFTEWALSMSALPPDTDQGERPPAELMMVLPFVKVLVMMILPALLVLVVRSLLRLLVKAFRASE